MKKSTLLSALLVIGTGMLAAGCSSHNHANLPKDTVNVDNGDDAPTIDPAMIQDTTSARVAFDLYEGLTSFDQSNKPIPGLADHWEVSADGKTYTFHLRSGLKFSNGSRLSAQDVVFSYQRVADPKVGSPYNFLMSNIVNGQAIIDGKLPVSQLGIKASDPLTITIQLVHPDPAFLQICGMPNLGVVSQAEVSKFGNAWTDPSHLATSGAYSLTEWVVKGHMLLTKNPYYYDAKNVAIKKINFLPIVDTNASLNQYKSGQVDITNSLPVDQYNDIKQEYPQEEHTVGMEALYYYDFNMTEARFKNNPKLRQALSMAVDRDTLVKQVLGQGQIPAYSYVTSTIEGGKFAGVNYEWSTWPRAKQLDTAKQLFTAAGYGPNNPLKITISYNTNDGHQKIALALASMWQQVFGAGSIQVTPTNQEWKTFLRARNTGAYDVARDGWNADYNSVNNYADLFRCNNPQNNAKYCNPAYDKLMQQADATTDSSQHDQLIRQALAVAQNDYAIIPLYQYTYYRLVSPRIKGYTPDTNHFDHVMSKWYRIN